MGNMFTIVFPVAGMSSRFGGKIKQFADVGPDGETLIEYSLNQAISAGFNKIIFIIGEKTEEPFREKFGDSYRGIPIVYTKQSFDSEQRDKPWGTTDALCTIKDVIDSPFVMCNGDDIYGEGAFSALIDHLKNNDSSVVATLGYKLASTLSDGEEGNRAIYDFDDEGFVLDVNEDLGRKVSKENLIERGLKDDSLCSMNIFALYPETVDTLYDDLVKFKRENVGNRKIESYVATELSNLIKSERTKMKCYPTDEQWFGVTSPEDVDIVKSKLASISVDNMNNVECNKCTCNADDVKDSMISSSVVDEMKKNILNQFDLMEKELKCDFDDTCQTFANTRLREVFIKRMDELKGLVARGEIDPDFKLNINRGDNHPPVNRPVRVAVFALAGDPPHWGHLIMVLDAIIDHKLDKVIFISNGNDARKPDLLDFEIRYSMIRSIVSIFNPFMEFGNVAEIPIFDESIPLIGEHTLFRFLKMNPNSEIKAYYLVGSDHLNRTVIRDGVSQKDTVGLLEDNIENKSFDYNPDKHKVGAIFSARNSEEYERNFANLGETRLEILKLNPTVAFSSTAIREALANKGSRDALILLPYIVYKQILDNDLYKD